MSRPSSDRLSAAERRQAIIQAAQPLFAARGFDAVTTREVAEAANISEALLYRHFESKAALYEAVQLSCIHQLIDDSARRIEALPDNTSTLVLAIYLMMRNIQLATMPDGAEQIVSRFGLRSLLTDGEFARNLVQFAAARWFNKVERCIRAGIAAGDIEESLEHAMTGFWFSHHLATALVFYRLPGKAIVDYPVADRDTLFDFSVRYALRGLGLTNAAIERYYQPQIFSLLIGQNSRG